MRSAATKLGEIVDCRQIKLSGRYYSLPSITADRLVQEYYSFIMDCLAKNCVLTWSTSPRKVSLSDYSALCDFQNQFEVYDFYLYAFVKSDIVYNKKSLREYKRYQSNTGIFGSIPGANMSADYSKYYYRIVRPYIHEPVNYKKALLKLFNMEGKSLLGEYWASDIQVSCWKCRSRGNNGLYLGEFSLDVGVFSLDGTEDAWAERLLQFGKELSTKYENVNIQIEMNPSHDTYTRYYGEYLKRGPLDLNDALLWECASHLYLMGVGWAQVISPATLELETVRVVDSEIGIVNEEQLSNGAKVIRANAPISNVGISDLKGIKRHIYSLIMPRKNKPDVQERPRCYWEMIPVFDNELTIVDGEFRLEHKGSIDQQKVYDLMRVKPLE
ncbi:MAG: hypothetical protein IKO00_09330 [Oscillospiraceae bacterium]|nr:hypothetical protein [Oscillospiraceae bacterium]